MILAAGLGTRMGSISRYLAKPAVPFLGVPLIEHSVGVLRSGGITEIAVNLHHLPETVRGVLGDGSHLGVRITYSLEDPILGTGGGIGRMRDFFGGETFAVLNSDVLVDVNPAEVLRAHRRAGAAATLALRRDEEGRYGSVMVGGDGSVRSIEGFPPGAATGQCESLMFAGLHVIEPRWFDYAPPREAYDSIADVYGPMLAAGEKVLGYRFGGRWLDLGSARRLLEATTAELVGSLVPPSARVGLGSSVRCSALTPETVVGEGCSLREVLCLGPARIGDGCDLRRCILCPGAAVPDNTTAREAVLADGESQPLAELPA